MTTDNDVYQDCQVLVACERFGRVRDAFIERGIPGRRRRDGPAMDRTAVDREGVVSTDNPAYRDGGTMGKVLAQGNLL